SYQSLEASQEQSLDPGEAIVQLSENFRLTKDLGEFVETIYTKKFRAMNTPKHDIIESLQLWLGLSWSEDRIMEAARVFLLDLANASAMPKKGTKLSLKPPQMKGDHDSEGGKVEPLGQASLALLRVSAPRASIIPYEAHVKAEARLAAALVHWIRESFGHEETIFVACPHRIQRSAVRQAILGAAAEWEEITAEGEEIKNEGGNGGDDDIDNVAAQLAALHVSETSLRIDTVERLQGSEATFVIFLLSHTHMPSLSNHLAFLLSRRRLNVGISRAKSICIVVSSRGVLQPSLHALANEDTRQGLQFLRAYEERAWSGDIELEL
ncbi:Tripartite DNA replication factor, partial [Serendipita sp. 411]